MKNVLITGGSSGIGLAIAGKLIETGEYQVISLSRNHEKMERGFRAYPHLKGKIDMIFGDVSNPVDCERVLTFLQEKYQVLHGLVNNAGILTKGGMEDTNIGNWQRTLDINLTGPYMLTQTLLPLMKKAGGASILNISSVAASKPGTSIAYSVSKAGLDLLTLFLAGELGVFNIRVNAINPGLVRTNLHFDNEIVADQLAYEKMIQQALPRYPLGRIGDRDDIAEMALFLLSEKVSWVTGSLMRIDGGSSVFNDLLPPKF